MKIKYLAAAGLLALTNALIAETPAESGTMPGPSLAGFYVGAVAGASQNNSALSGDTSTLGGYWAPQNAARATAIARGAASSWAPHAGLDIGYNWQMGPWVLGAEADLDPTKASVERRYVGQNNSLNTADQLIESDWLATARMRAGTVLAQRWLVFATGGLAVSGLQTADSFTDEYYPTTARATGQTVALGWVAGAGAEWILARHWGLKLEYLCLGFPNAGTTGLMKDPFGPDTSTYQFASTLTMNVGRLGVNYFF